MNVTTQHSRNLRALFSPERLRFTLTEFSGGLGDLGTFIPLAVGVALVSGMDLPVILIWAGVFSIIAGVFFGLPVPIQPMKAIAAVAIAERLTPGAIGASGVLIGALVFATGITGVMKTINRFIPTPLVRGIQLGVGIKLAISGLQYISDTPLFAFDSVTTATVLAVMAVAVNRYRKFPAALVMVLCGVVIVVLDVSQTGVAGDLLEPGLPVVSLISPSAAEWNLGFWEGALPQLPLTILNSVIAVCALSGDLFGERRIPQSKMALAVGAMNLIAAPFGALPMCHGSGGLAAQHFFGARTGGAVVLVGALKIAVALVFGAGITHVLQAFPLSILGIMLLFAGVELALPARDQTSRGDFFIALLTAVGIVAINTGVGFVIGACAAALWRWVGAGGEQGG